MSKKNSITNTNLYNEVMNHAEIYSLLYSPALNKEQSLDSQIESILTEWIEWDKDRKGFSYTWGFPGIDMNRYTADTYGKGWAFTKEEIVNAWLDEDPMYVCNQWLRHCNPNAGIEITKKE